MLTIPLNNGAANSHQEFTVTLGDETFDVVINYIESLNAPAWSLDLWQDGERFKSGFMLEPYATIDLGGELGKLIFVGEEVTNDNLGVDNSLIWIAYYE